MPKLALKIPGLSISSVYTCGSVTKAPPSFFQCLMSGKSEILISWYLTGLLSGFFKGSALIAASPAVKLSSGCLRASIGLLLN